MDDIVIQAMKKWPNVPDCYGWLHLNAQGQWLMGEHNPTLIEHEGLKAFIARNYLCPQPQVHKGGWALQNGPQRVWVNLSLAPFIVHLHGSNAYTHTHEPVHIQRLIQSSDGVMYCITDKGPGAIASSSMEVFAQNVIAVNIDPTLENTLGWQVHPQATLIMIELCDAPLIETRLHFSRKPQHPSLPNV